MREVLSIGGELREYAKRERMGALITEMRERRNKTRKRGAGARITSPEGSVT